MTDEPRPTPPDQRLVAARGKARAPIAAGALMLVQGSVLLLLAGFYGYEMAVGAADSLTTAATSGALILIFGIAMLFVARGWLRGQSWPRTPTLVWNALLLPVAWSLHQSEQTLLAIGLALLSGACLVAAVAAAPAPARLPGEPEPRG
ncbi:hypothetical protein OO014_05920 [Intrasporangium calvum]|uniref:Integral membrane protein n=1 Tax=Intrasporangium calvum TaxID=53358 RepID=A0ABT5GEX4_9MICO|nr:hypothetical protein [Intrasporangium calvum]MDC5696788.1 hypothetical protein [Intrasporangium calvum]